MDAPSRNSPQVLTEDRTSGRRDDGDDLAVLVDADVAGELIQAHVSQLASAGDFSSSTPKFPTNDVLAVGLAALDAFLQINVTGPVIPQHLLSAIESRFVEAWKSSRKDPSGDGDGASLRRACLAHLDVDGVSPYSHISHPELFSLARFVLLHGLEHDDIYQVIETPSTLYTSSKPVSIAWWRLRVNVWHYKLLTQPSLGSGSNFIKSSQWTDVPSLTSTILDAMDALHGRICDGEVWSSYDDTAVAWPRQDQARFLVEAATNYILLGYYDKAKERIKEAAQASGFQYALSGALGKRTKFQEKSTSQLLVLARSRHEPDDKATPDGDAAAAAAKPDALRLDDDTLLEEIDFATGDGTASGVDDDLLPPGLADLSLSPNHDQPQLAPLDQILLLAEATLKDSSSPADTLTSEEVLPFAVRVLADKQTNWQIYTQALLVRSRIELHRSRTVERGVFQLQALADQVMADTSCSGSGQPTIQVTGPDEVHNNGSSPITNTTTTTTTSFFPPAKASESAPARVRLRYIHALSTPPRWHLESELAHAWAGVGSLTSALEIFKRLRLWAEVALCLAAAAASDDDEDGRGGGGEAKARAIIRWQLFHHQNDDDGNILEDVDEVIRLGPDAFTGPERDPPPANAPRLWCILGDVEDEASHYHRAWSVSHQRYSRAQRSVGEWHLRRQEWALAQEAYRLATSVNRLSPELWTRLGDISLRRGLFQEAVTAYGRALSCSSDAEDARTWSNLASSLWSLACESAGEDEQGAGKGSLVCQSLSAFKRASSLAHDNWRIWENVLTMASRVRPPSLTDMVLALSNILRIKQSEDAIDISILTFLLQHVTLSRSPSRSSSDDKSTAQKPSSPSSIQGQLTTLFESQIVPLVTRRHELWTLTSRLRNDILEDLNGSADAAERAWRCLHSSLSNPNEEVDEKGKDINALIRATIDLVTAQERAQGPRWRQKSTSAVRAVLRRRVAAECHDGDGCAEEEQDAWLALEAVAQRLGL
ncbi:hypothetical protein CP532_4954 [Ophiocordyceps camponoti-leonardi (nom. inval.)]|nr:hypothetical protein CP532_4954 [Ophiocordyceps camponoti-leonardi (nom. inval.)]